MTIDAEALEKRFRTGRRVPRNVYDSGQPLFVARTADEAAAYVCLLNAGAEAFLQFAIQGDESREPEGSVEVERAYREGFKDGRDRGSAEASTYEWGGHDCGLPDVDDAWTDSLSNASRSGSEATFEGWQQLQRETLAWLEIAANTPGFGNDMSVWSELSSRVQMLCADHPLSAQSSPSAQARSSTPPLDGAGIPEVSPRMGDTRALEIARQIVAVEAKDECQRLARIQCILIDAALSPPSPENRKAESSLCEDCPPVGYPTDKTRCEPCPRTPPKSERI